MRGQETAPTCVRAASLTRWRNASNCSTDSRAASLEALCSSSRRRYSLLYSHNIEPKPDWPEALESVPPAARMASSRRVIKILAGVPDDTPAYEWKAPRGAPSFDGGGHGLADPGGPVDELRHGSRPLPPDRHAARSGVRK